MSNCRFCGAPAGFLRHEHSGCADKHQSGRRQIRDLILHAPSSRTPVEDAVSQVKQVAAESFISEPEVRELAVVSWTSAVDHLIDEGIPSEAVEQRLVDLKDALSLSQADVSYSGAWDRMVKSAVLRDLINGVIPKRISFAGNLPLNLQKNEEVVWAFTQVDYFEEKTRRQYVGGSRGVSVRVMKGVYYHAGGFRGHAVDRTELVRADKGLFALTTKHLYFSGATKAFRIPYTKIVTFEPFSDGLGIVRDAASARPQIFVTHDGWFTYNLVTNLAHL